MPLNGCSSGLLVSALVTLLLFPVHYYVPEYYLGTREVPLELQPVQGGSAKAQAFEKWFSLDFPPFDLFLTAMLVFIAMITYLCDWIQRKLVERRIIKLNQYLVDCLERLRRWDARQEQVEATLRMVQNATSEYNLLLFLLLRNRRLNSASAGPAKSPPSHCFFDKDLEDNINYMTNPTVQA